MQILDVKRSIHIGFHYKEFFQGKYKGLSPSQHSYTEKISNKKNNFFFFFPAKQDFSPVDSWVGSHSVFGICIKSYIAFIALVLVHNR